MFLIGRLGKPSGLEGFIGVYVDEADLVHLQPGSVVSIEGRSYTVRSLRQGAKGPQVAFEEIRDRSGAEELRGLDVHVAERRPLGADEFWPRDLIGLEVTPGGGRVVDVVFGPAQDRLVVERDAIRFEVPFVEAFVPRVDLETGVVEIVEIEGLIPPTDRD
ncbi:MAG TPA: ribosome maturation factor RimM [Acidimicrobiia bacterium]|nr:ribosome maturation factor RimM [Acidimicrobiia bacterium]